MYALLEIGFDIAKPRNNFLHEFERIADHLGISGDCIIAWKFVQLSFEAWFRVYALCDA